MEALASAGEAIGTVAAQSIGEPTTQVRVLTCGLQIQLVDVAARRIKSTLSVMHVLLQCGS